MIGEGEAFPAIADLFTAVLNADPAYLPGVASESVPLRAWYSRKEPQRVRTIRTPASEPNLAAHSGVRLNGMLPDRRMLEEAGAPRLSWELSMLVVRPGFRGCGLAKMLVEDAEAAFPSGLWASVHRDRAGYNLLRSAKWQEVTSFFWPNDPAEGLVMVSPQVTLT